MHECFSTPLLSTAPSIEALCVLLHMKHCVYSFTCSLLILQVGAVDIEPTWSTGMINFVFDTAKFPNVTEMVRSYISWGYQVYNRLFVTVSVLDCVHTPPIFHSVWAHLIRKVLGMWLDSCTLSSINKWHPLCSSFMNYHTRSYNFKNLKETDHTSDHYTSHTLLTWDTRAHCHGVFFPIIFHCRFCRMIKGHYVTELEDSFSSAALGRTADLFMYHKMEKLKPGRE